MGNWPIKAYLMRRFGNQQSYDTKCEKENVAAANAAGAALADTDDMRDFGSNNSASDERDEQ